jgi:hypothetical protein
MRIFLRLYKEYKTKKGIIVDYKYVKVGEQIPGWRFCFTNYKRTFKEWETLIKQYPHGLYTDQSTHLSQNDFWEMLKENQCGMFNNHYSWEYLDETGHRFSTKDDVR